MPSSRRLAALPHRVSLAVPVRHDVQAIVRRFGLAAGGCTAIPAQGAWHAPDGRVLDEPIVWMQVAFTSAQVPAVQAAIDRTIAELLSQGEEAVFWTLNDQAHLASAPDRDVPTLLSRT